MIDQYVGNKNQKFDHIGMNAPPMIRNIEFINNNESLLMSHGGPMLAL